MLRHYARDLISLRPTWISINRRMEVSALKQNAAFVSTRRCEVVTNFSELEQFSSDWERLWRADPEAEIFQTFSWARAWWRSYGQKLTLCSLVVFDADEVIGILPLVKDGDTIKFMGGTQADYCDILCEDDRIDDVLSAGMQKLLELPDWKRCVFHNLKREGRIVKHCAALSSELRGRLQVVSAGDCHTILVDQNDDVLASLLGKNHTRRRLNKLRKAGSLTFRHIATKADAQIHLDQFFKHQIRRRALAGKESAASAPEFQQFLRALVTELELENELLFGVLELDSRPLAWHFSFQANGKLALYQQTLDIDAWDYTPGEVLIHQLLLYVKQNAFRELDFSHGNEPFKDRFTTHRRKMCSVYLDRSGALGKLRQLRRASVSPLLRVGKLVQHMAKRHDKTIRAFRTIRLWAGGVVDRARYYQGRGMLIDWGWKTGVKFLRRMPSFNENLGLFLRPNNGVLEPVMCSNSMLQVREGHCGDLVDLARQNPQIAVAFEVARYRQRIKMGAKLYLAWQGSDVVLAAWAATDWPEDVLPLKSRHSDLSRNLMLVYDLWILDDRVATSACPELLLQLSNVARKSGLRLALCCNPRFEPLYSALMHQGFRQAYWLERDPIGRRFRVIPLQSSNSRREEKLRAGSEGLL